MVEFIPIDLKLHKTHLISLNEEHLTWIASEMQKRYDVDLISIIGQTLEEFAKKSVEELSTYMPPKGIYYILQVKEKIAGMGALRKLEMKVGEIKRMYIRPKYRGKGFGKAMLQQLLRKGLEFGCSTIRLDTALFMTTAQHIYRLAGFQNRDKYLGSEIPKELRHLCLYMEKNL